MKSLRIFLEEKTVITIMGIFAFNALLTCKIVVMFITLASM